MIENEVLIGLDIETSNGFGEGSLNSRDPNSFIALMQFSFEDTNEEIRVMRADEGMRLLHELNRPNVRFIIHNAFFELDWFLHKYDFPIHTMNVWCPMTASQILNAGKHMPDKASWLSTKMSKKNNEYLGKWNPLIHENDNNIEEAKSAKFTHNLQATVYRYANGVIVEKDQGNSDWANPNLTEEQLRYAKDDVRYLIEIARNQWEFVKKFGLERVIDLEMSLIPATVEMKKNGMKIDTSKWEESALDYKRKALELEGKLNEVMGLELARREGNVSLFGSIIPKAFNVSSSSQVASYFNLPSADEAHLRELLGKDPIIADLLDYKEYFKISSTYGKNYLKFLDTSDDRIHSMLVQTETATGRYCISKGTMVEVIRDVSKHPKGIPIEDVKVGDMVYTYDDSLNLTIKPVVWSGKTGNKKVIRLHWKGQGNKHVGFLDLTPEHRVRKSSGEYVEAKDLLVGDSVLALSRGPTNKYQFKDVKKEFYPEEKIYNHKITKIDYLDESVDVYDLEVQDTHNFIANEICVHNSSRKPNLQNVPRDMLKGFITVDRNKVLLTIDYSSMESRILAYAAGDENFIKAVNSEDVHWENAKNIFKLPENANKRDLFYVDFFKRSISGDELRRMAKGVSFGIPYGISAIGLVSRGFAENEEQGQELIDGFLNQYPNVKRFLDRAKAEGLFNGYTQDSFGRIRWHQKPKRGEASDEEIKKIESSIARRSQNHKIQSMSANITKMAIKDLYYYLKEKNYGKMVLTIHDSVFFEIDEDTAGVAIEEILRIMEGAGPKVHPGMVVPVDLDVGSKETRICDISGLKFYVYSHIYENGKLLRNLQNIEPRIFSLLDGQFDNFRDARQKILLIISEKDDKWRKENADIVNIFTK